MEQIVGAKQAGAANAALVLWNGDSPGSAHMIETGRDVLGDDNVYVHKYREETDQFL